MGVSIKLNLLMIGHGTTTLDENGARSVPIPMTNFGSGNYTQKVLTTDGHGFLTGEN